MRQLLSKPKHQTRSPKSNPKNKYKDESLFLLSYIKFMGNINICCVEQNDEPFDKRKYLFHKKLNNLNNQLIS